MNFSSTFCHSYLKNRKYILANDVMNKYFKQNSILLRFIQLSRISLFIFLPYCLTTSIYWKLYLLSYTFYFSILEQKLSHLGISGSICLFFQLEWLYIKRGHCNPQWNRVNSIYFTLISNITFWKCIRLNLISWDYSISTQRCVTKIERRKRKSIFFKIFQVH